MPADRVITEEEKVLNSMISFLSKRVKELEIRLQAAETLANHYGDLLVATGDYTTCYHCEEVFDKGDNVGTEEHPYCSDACKQDDAASNVIGGEEL